MQGRDLRMRNEQILDQEHIFITERKSPVDDFGRVLDDFRPSHGFAMDVHKARSVWVGLDEQNATAPAARCRLEGHGTVQRCPQSLEAEHGRKNAALW